jgi:hypothetical protein
MAAIIAGGTGIANHRNIASQKGVTRIMEAAECILTDDEIDR